ncbi:hypothetical protein NDU88_001494, partial [Pleurodeles waltl]
MLVGLVKLSGVGVVEVEDEVPKKYALLRVECLHGDEFRDGVAEAGVRSWWSVIKSASDVAFSVCVDLEVELFGYR